MIKNFNEKFSGVFLRSWRPFFWLAAVIFLIYSATLSASIVFLDDNQLVTGQYEFNKNLANIPQAFNDDIFQSGPNQGTFYRPLLCLSFMLDAQFGEEVLIFTSHLSNLLFHIIAIFLFFYFLLKLNISRWRAFLLALIAGVHPLTAQTVAFIAGRNDSLLAIFVFSALIFFLNFLETKKIKYFIWHLVFFILALLSKETAIVLPAVCAAYLLIFIGWRKVRADFGTYLVLLAYWASLAAVWFLARHLVLDNFIGNADYNIFLSIYQNLPALIPMLGKIFFPVNLSVFPVLKDMTMFYGLLSLAILAAWFFISSRKNLKFIIFGFVWFFLFIILALLKPTGTVSEFSENRIYLPLFGFIFVILGLDWGKSPETMAGKINNEAGRQKIFLIISLAIALIFSSITVYRNRYYRDGLSFWGNAAETSPNFAFNHNNLGAMYYLNHDFAKAEKSYRQALVLNKKEPMVHNNLGLIYLDQKRFNQAEREFKQELAINPEYDKALFNLGELYYQQDMLSEAQPLFLETIRVNPRYYQAYERLNILEKRLR